MRRTARVVVVTAVAAVVIAGGVVAADVALRSYAEGQIRQSIVEELPRNVTGDVSVTIGGGSFLVQYLAGSFDSVDLQSQNLAVGGVPVVASITAQGVATDQTKPVAHVTATVTLDQAAVNSFVSIPDSNQIVLGAGTVGYQGSVTVLGLPLGYEATATVAPWGPDVLLTPTDAKLSSGSASIDVGGALTSVIQSPISICVAGYLPEGVQLTSITPTVGSVTVTAEASNLAVTQKALGTTGSCG